MHMVLEYYGGNTYEGDEDYYQMYKDAFDCDPDEEWNFD